MEKTVSRTIRSLHFTAKQEDGVFFGNNRTDDITHDAFRIGFFKERVCSHSKSLRQSATLRNALNFRLEMG